MEQSIILNFKVLKEVDLSIKEFLYLVDNYLSLDIDIKEVDNQKLQEKKFIKIIKEDNKEKIVIREKSIDLIKFSLVDSEMSFNTGKKEVKKSNRAVNLEITDRIEEFRNKWRGLKPGSMGSLKTCKIKLTRWMKENPSYSFDEVLQAADLYLETEGANLRFLQRADYFIFKQDSNKEESSRLSAFIEEINSAGSGDWTTNLN